MAKPRQQRRPSELELIESLRRTFAVQQPKYVQVGIGDDAAVLQARGPLVWTIDDSVEGVHFDRAWLTIGQAAARAFQAALSDLAAMGASPLGALVSLQAPAAATALEFQAIRKAQAASAEASRCAIIGGNVTSGPGYRFSTTLLGTAKHPVLRSSARPGHELWLFGAVGLAGCGRAWLERGLPRGRSALARAVGKCVRAWQEPQALLGAGASLDGRRHAALDVSDGLGLDGHRLALASGVRLAVDEARLRAALQPALVAAAQGLGRDPLEFALFGGEDYALLASGPGASRPKGAAVIGSVLRGKGAVLVSDRSTTALAEGYDHLRGANSRD